MFAYIWPIALVVVCNTLYQVCAKSVPAAMDPFASLTITYLVGAAASFALYFVINRQGDLLREYRELNWAPIVLGFVVVALEVGMIFAYKAGWKVSLASTVQGTFVAIALVAVGALFYHEAITIQKIVGIGLCLAGLAVMNR
ncbi:MAG: EamA family transporter [Oscillospiraceae bacterium]|nr:EamA family transporter [Oscillospiraceae bacterium]